MLQGQLGDDGVGVRLPVGRRHQTPRSLQGRDSSVDIPRRVERLGQLHLYAEAAGVVCGELFQLIDGRLIGDLRCLERRPQGRVLTIEPLIEACLDLVERGVERRLERRICLEPLAVRPQQPPQRRFTVGVDEVLDDQGRLVIDERDHPRIAEAFVDVAEFEELPGRERLGERNLALPAPLWTSPPLLELRNALGDPPGHAVIGHLQADYVRHLVPERSGPAKGARRSGAR